MDYCEKCMEVTNAQSIDREYVIAFGDSLRAVES